jgi:hypothetical protein
VGVGRGARVGPTDRYQDSNRVSLLWGQTQPKHLAQTLPDSIEQRPPHHRCLLQRAPLLPHQIRHYALVLRRRWIKVVAVLLGVGVLALGCGALALQSWKWDPPANAEARRREQILVDLQPKDLHVGRLIYVGSDAGKRAGQGDFQLGDEVSATRRYAFTGEPRHACEAIVKRLIGSGWVEGGPAYGCAVVQKAPSIKGDGLWRYYLFVDLTFDCVTFQVDARLTLITDEAADPPQEVTLRFETAYPESESPPPGQPQPNCAPHSRL